jgi:hypothetical protein
LAQAVGYDLKRRDARQSVADAIANTSTSLSDIHDPGVAGISYESMMWAVAALGRTARFNHFRNQERAVAEGALKVLLVLLRQPAPALQMATIACICLLLDNHKENIDRMVGLEGDQHLIMLSSDVKITGTGEVRTAAAQALTVMGCSAPDPNDTPRPSPRYM